MKFQFDGAAAAEAPLAFRIGAAFFFGCLGWAAGPQAEREIDSWREEIAVLEGGRTVAEGEEAFSARVATEPRRGCDA